MKRWLQVSALFGALLMTTPGSPVVQAQQVEPIGGPYTADANTRLLLQFEGDFSNASDQSDDAIPHGSAQIFPISATGEFGQSLYLQNDSHTDSSFVYVPHSEGLNLDGDWTIELWFMVQTFGTSAEDHRWVPVLMWKRGDTTFDQGNYFMEIWGNTRHLSTGYSVAGHGWPQVNSPQNMIQPGEWYHATLIRDTEHNVLVQMIHDTDRNLLWSGTHTYNPETQATPNITQQPLYLGTNWDDRAVQPGFMDGFMDEIRISDVVRNFAIPPVIRSLDQLANQTADATQYPEINADVIQIGGSPLSTVTLHYNAGNGWQEVAMTLGDSLYAAAIPQQPIHSVVQYYVTAENENGMSSVFPGNALAEENPDYFVFAVEEPETNTLYLSFEEGEGTPVDYSVYENPIYVFGQPEHSTDAAVGNYSLLFNGITDYLEVPTSVVGDHEEFTVDFWMNANSLEGPWRFIVNKPAIVPGFWGENTYEIISQPDRRLTAGVWSAAGGNTRITLPDVVEFGEWYRVIMEVRRAPEGDLNNYYLFFQLHDENDEVLSTDFAGFEHRPQVSRYPLRIGKAGGDRPYFDGKIDNFRYYNYAQAQISIEAPPNIASVAELGNQPAGVTYPPVETDVVRGLGGEITEVTLHYNAGDGWVEAEMTHVEGTRYSGEIPQQPVHTIVMYYVSATNADGFRALFPAGAESDTAPDYLLFAVEEPNSKVLGLTFDEGEGVPQDASAYNTTVVVHGAPTYSTDSATGSHSLEFNGETDYLEVLSPLVGGADEFSLDFWMNANSLTGFWRFLVNKPALQPPFWGENTVEIITGAFDDPEPRLTAGLWSHAGGNTRITLPYVIQMETWYRVIFEVQRAPEEAETNYYAIFQLRDADNEMLSHAYEGFNEPPTRSRHPLRLGKAGGDRPFYDGKFDDVRVYNYPHHQLTLTSTGDDLLDELPFEYTLSQNYPNPFNPSTVIQYGIPESGLVTLRIFDVLGREVATLVNEEQSVGNYRVNFDASLLGSGLYFYQIVAGDNFTATRKMMLVK